VPAGLMMALNDETVWTVVRAKSGYAVIAADRAGKGEAESRLPDFSGQQIRYKTLWLRELGIRPRSMLQAGEMLVFGGTTKGLVGNPFGVKRQSDKQGRIQILSVTNGSVLGETSFDASPVWDGMAAAEGSLFVPCVDGSVVSFR